MTLDGYKRLLDRIGAVEQSFGIGQPRVPWANEPGCGSCHTGDNTNRLTGTGLVVNTVDSNGNTDGIRLRQAFRVGDAKATPIVPTNKRFAEPAVPASFNGFANPGAGNPQLYRVSTGHGGVMCEGCHGATHAEWDADSSPLQNDNVTANQLQGHSGTVIECNTCHATGSMDADTQEGPHGMHLVNDSRFWKEAHKDLAKAENRKANGGSCAACHGKDHLGTVLSRAPVTRTFTVEGSSRRVVNDLFDLSELSSEKISPQRTREKPGRREEIMINASAGSVISAVKINALHVLRCTAET